MTNKEDAHQESKEVLGDRITFDGALEMLGRASDQSILIMDRYKYLDGADEVLELNIPATDKEMSALALLNIIKGQSCGIFYPYPESDYCILPLLGPLAHNLVGKNGFYIVMSRSANWSDIYGRIRKNATDETSGLLRHLHPYATLGVDGRPVNQARAKDSTMVHHLVFSRWKTELNEDCKNHLKGVIIDTGPPRCKVDSFLLEELVIRSKVECYPIIVIFFNPNGSVPRILVKHNIGIVACPRITNGFTDFSSPGIDIQSTCCPYDEVQSRYLHYCQKVRSSDNYPDIEIVKLHGNDILRELNEGLQKLLYGINEEKATAQERALAAYSSYTESIIRNCWTKIGHYEEAASSSFGAETLNAATIHIGRMSRKIYENNSKLGLFGIEFEGMLEKALSNLKTEGSEKSIWLEKQINTSDKSKEKLFYNYGRIQQKALNIFIDPYSNEGWQIKSISPYNLSYLDKVEELLIPGTPLHSQTFVLRNISAKKVIVLCYPWEEDAVANKLLAYDKKVSIWGENTNLFLGSSERQSGDRQESGNLAHKTAIVRQGSEIAKRSTQSSTIEIGSLLDYLEIGENPDEKGRESTERNRTFKDIGNSAKWYIKTDLGDMYLNANRRLTTVFQTYSLPKYPNELIIGNVILVGSDFNPRPMSHYVWDILARKGVIKEGALWGEWKRKLREFCETHPEENHHTIFERLKAAGDCRIETPSAVYCWLNSDELIGPQDKSSIMAIGNLIGAGKTECNMWWASIEQVRSALRSAYAQLWRLTKHYANNLASGMPEDILLSEELNIWLSDIGELVTFAKVIMEPALICSEGRTDDAERKY